MTVAVSWGYLSRIPLRSIQATQTREAGLAAYGIGADCQQSGWK